MPSSVTYAVSNGPPPRSELSFVKTPAGLSRRKKPPRVYTDQQRRAAVSQLAFSTVVSRSRTARSGMKQYEAGQVLEFADGAVAGRVDPMLVPQETHVRHDTNLLDYGAIGLPPDVQGAIEAESAAAYRTLCNMLAEAIAARQAAEAAMQLAQKKLNETNKAIAAIDGVLAIAPSSTLEDARASLAASGSLLSAEITAQVAAANAAAASASSLRDQVNSVSQLVR